MRPRSASLVLALLAAACGGSDPLAPADLAGTYVLRTANGGAPPYVLFGSAGAGFTSVVADTLTLRADGTLELAQTRRSGGGCGAGCVTPGPIVTAGVRATGTWALRGRALTLTVGGGAPYLAGTFAGSVAGGGAISYRDEQGSFTGPVEKAYARP